MQMPHRIPPTTGVSHHLPHRMKSSSKSGNPTTSPPYFHHFLDRNTSINSTSNAFYVNPPTAYGENTSALNNPSGKRPRLGTTSSTTSFLSPFPMYSIPQSFDTDHALPDLAVNSGYTNRSNLRSHINNSNATFTASLSSTAMASHGHASSSSFGAIESPNGASMFADPSFLPDYDSSLYSLWNGPGGNVMGYEPENVITPNQQQSPLYMTSDDELKMAYPQLPEFNQDLESYLNDSIEPGGPSPTTPLGTTKPNSMMKMGHLMTSERRNGTGQNVTIGTRESQLEKLLAPASTDDYLLKRDEGSKVENTSKHIGKRSSRDNNDAYAVHPVTSGNTMEASASTNSFRILSRNSTTVSLPSQTEESTSLATTVVSTSSAAGLPHSKRPRSRQCEFPGCQNRARSHQKCKKHGGAHQCVFEGCTKNSQSRGLCIAHGGGSRCKKEGCARAAQSKGLCKSHGGGEYCAVEGCNKKAHLRHLCRTHGGGVRCKFAKCLKWAQRKGWCMAHAKEFAAS